MSTVKSNDKLSYGITILIFGVLFLLDKTGFLDKIPYGGNFISVGGILSYSRYCISGHTTEEDPGMDIPGSRCSSQCRSVFWMDVRLL